MYLTERGVGEDDAARAVERLTEAGYVDDVRFACDRAAVLARRDYGDEAIRHDLEGRGLERNAIDAALALLEPEEQRARALTVRFGVTPATGRRLVMKGFSQAACESALAGAPRAA